MSDLPDPFKCAKRIAGVSVLLRPEDIVNACPGVVRERVDRLLDRHGGTLAAAMLAAGIEAAAQIIRQEGASS